MRPNWSTGLRHRRKQPEAYVDSELASHRPSEGARLRAKSAGLDLDRLKREDPTTYRMLCAVPVVRVAPELQAQALAPLEAALDDQALFQAELADSVLVLAFPGPDAEALERLDRSLGEVAERESGRYGYYRVVRDETGTRRELDLPSSPQAWQGEETMVGPFADESEAGDWAEANVDRSAGRTYDTVKYGGGWFCDVFDAGNT